MKTYYRCACGQLEYMAHEPRPTCVGCPECGTVAANHPQWNTKPSPHLWINTAPFYWFCSKCRTRAPEDLYQDTVDNQPISPGQIEAFTLKVGDPNDNHNQN